jgi:hypothetical protein
MFLDRGKDEIKSRILLGINFSIRNDATTKATVTQVLVRLDQESRLRRCKSPSCKHRNRLINLVKRAATVCTYRAVPVGEVIVAHTIERVLAITLCTWPASGALYQGRWRAAIVRASNAVSVLR